jgi:2'-5' RNA ligase
LTRAFVAVRPPDAVLDEVARVIADLEVTGARLTTRDQWHVTLQFLGNRADVDAVGEALDALAVRAGPAQLGGFGAFPNERRARVLWLGLADGAALFGHLAAAVSARLAPLGHEPEARPFHPHLTLARLKTPSDVRPAVASLPGGAIGDAWTVGEVLVYESRLRRSGAEYVPRAAITLSG